MDDIALITVRTGSTRLPDKCLLPFGGWSVLEHVVNRAIYYNLIPVISTSDLPEDDVIEKMAREKGINYFRGDSEDKLGRWNETCKYFKVKDFHTVDADDPFFDGDMVKKSLKLLRDNGQDMISPFGEYIGQVGYSLTAEIVKKACAIKQTENTEMMWWFIRAVPKVKYYPEVAPTLQIRLTLDYPEDYTLLRKVIAILGCYASSFEILELFRKHPELSEINWFRNEQWKKRQNEN